MRAKFTDTQWSWGCRLKRHMLVCLTRGREGEAGSAWGALENCAAVPAWARTRLWDEGDKNSHPRNVGQLARVGDK